jgi:hypothetical protein
VHGLSKAVELTPALIESGFQVLSTPLG